MSDMLERLMAAKATMEGDDDNLCRVLIMLAANRHITLVPQDERLTPKPVILVPQRLYNRINKLIEEGNV